MSEAGDLGRLARRRSTAVAWLTLVAALVATYVYAFHRRSELVDAEPNRFRDEADGYLETVGSALDDYAALLKDSRVRLAADGVVEAEEFEDFAAPRSIPTTYPGALGLVYIERVPDEQLGSFLAEQRERGLEVTAPVPPGERSEYWLGRFTVPRSTFDLPLLDNRQIATTRKAMERSAVTGEPVLSAPADIPLFGDDEEGTVSVFGMYLPVYRGTALSGPEDRGLADVEGWLSVVVLGDNFVTHVVAESDFGERVVISSESGTGSGRIGAYPGAQPPRGHALEVDRSVSGYGTTWDFEFSSLGPLSSDRVWREPLLIGLAGTAIGALLFAGLYVLARGRARALALFDDASITLDEVEERFRRAFEDAPIGMALVGYDGRLQRTNRALAGLLGLPEADLVGASLEDFVHAEDWEEVRGLFDAFTEGATAEPIERHLVDAHGRTVTAAMSVSRVRGPMSGGRSDYFIVQVEDVTDRKLAEERLAHQATHDSLTDLPNRGSFDELLDRALSHGADGLAVLYVDLDRFKLVNDAFGHVVGDEVLQIVARRIHSALRPGDVVARMGGDEFTVLATGTRDHDDAHRIGQRVAQAIDEQMQTHRTTITVTASVGVARATVDSSTHSLLRDADIALYRAKSRGRARVELFTQDVHSEATRALDTERELRHAIERREMVLHYQPEIDLRTGRVAGVEALMRWQHPSRGLLPPAEFIDVAEDSGLIVPLGSWAIAEACREAARLHHRRPDDQLVMSVNLSARQFLLPDLAEIVAAALDDSHIDPSQLCLEITESALMDDAESTIESLRALHALGVQLSVDDFGTGYSSLGYLKRFPVDWLKVDQSFVDGLGADAEDTAIVAAVVSLAHALDLGVVAEGVETANQLAHLRTLGCDLGQGRYFSHPEPPDALMEFLSRYERERSPQAAEVREH